MFWVFYAIGEKHLLASHVCRIFQQELSANHFAVKSANHFAVKSSWYNLYNQDISDFSIILCNYMKWLAFFSIIVFLILHGES